MKRLLMILLLSPVYFLCREKDVYMDIPEIQDPCEVKVCRLVEEIVHEEQEPIIVREKR